MKKIFKFLRPAYNHIREHKSTYMAIVASLYLVLFYGTRAIRSVDVHNTDEKRVYGFSEFEDLISQHLTHVSDILMMLESKEVYVMGISVSERTYERLYLLSALATAFLLWGLLATIKTSTNAKIGTVGVLIFGAVLLHKIDSNSASENALIKKQDSSISSVESSVYDLEEKLDKELETISYKLDNLEYECSRRQEIRISTGY